MAYYDFRKTGKIDKVDFDKFAIDFENPKEYGSGGIKEYKLTYDGEQVKFISPAQKCWGLQDAYGDDITKKNLTLLFPLDNSDEAIQAHLETLQYLDEFVPKELKANMKKLFKSTVLKKVSEDDIDKGYSNILRQMIDKETEEISETAPIMFRSRLVHMKDDEGNPTDDFYTKFYDHNKEEQKITKESLPKNTEISVAYALPGIWVKATAQPGCGIVQRNHQMRSMAPIEKVGCVIDDTDSEEENEVSSEEEGEDELE